MSNAYVLAVIGPLILGLAAVTVYEWRTGIIPNIVTVPSALYFGVVSSLTGPQPWWQYPIALVLAICLVDCLQFISWKLSGHEMIGGGTWKVLGVVTGALGLGLGLYFITVATMMFVSLLAWMSTDDS